MKRKSFKIGLTVLFVLIALTILAIPTFAIHTGTGHHDPTGGLSGYYAYSSSECNRKINVYFYDTSGTLLRTVAIHTKTGEENSFSIDIGGYDIVKFESNKGIWQDCEMGWASGSGTGTEAQLYVHYLFRNLSKNELDITVTMRKWDPIKFEVRHYVQNKPNATGRNNYSYHSTTLSTTKDYYASISAAQRSITGYTLASGYTGSISGNLCFETLIGKYSNTPSNLRCYSYDYVNTAYADAMKNVTKYDESKDGKLSYCTNRVFWVEYFYDIKEYTVSYNANGGSGAPASQTKYHGYDMALSDTVPTRSGYTFKGWATSSTATTASYQPGGNYTANSTRTLYAVWESNAPKTYTVTYNANGGTGAPASQIKTHDVALTLRSEIPTRAGYTFKGWSTSSASTVGRYGAGSSYTNNASVTLYAAWQPNYTVSYDANGGTGAPASQTKLNNTTLYLSTTIPTRFNYAFLGWSTSSTATSPTYLAGGSYTTNADIKLYAVWQYDPVKYTISYDANGGSGAPSSQTKTYDVALTLSTTVPTRTGYTFKGWSTSASATSATYSAGGSYTANSGTTLYAVWQINTYSVSFNANGGSGAPSAQTMTHGTNLTLSTTKPTRTGYSFLGWATSASATSATYSAGGSYTSNSATTLYAVWKINTYTVSYNANGGSGAPSAQTKTYGTALTLSSTKPTRTGYTFQGWATSSSATSASYSAGGSYTSNSGATLYAVWKINTYTVSYNANGGSGAPSAQTKTYGTALTLSSTKPTRTGYTFQGWATSASATSATYSAGGSYTSNSGATLYAVWKINTYTVSYNANGGSGAPSAQTKTYGTALTLSSTKPTRTGYTFQGWATSSSATSATYSAGGSYTANSGTTLYAVWQINTYTVSYNANGGSGAPSAQTKTYGTSLTLSTTKPTRTGYTFLGWATSASATSASYSAGSSYTANSGATLYAVWKADTYTVSYNANGGSGAPSAQTKTYGVNLTLSSTKPTRAGYSFLGWATSASATSASYNAGSTYTSNGGTTLYAVWKPDTYTVTFKANGGNGVPSDQTKIHDVTLTLPTAVPTRTGYTFLGWATSASATSATYTAGGNYTANSGATLYAVWKANTYTVSYNANGGTGAPSAQTKTYGVNLTLSSVIPTRNGYSFLGWATSASATSATYSASGLYTSNNGVTLYAVWKVNTYTVRFDANGGTGAPSALIKTHGVNLNLPLTVPTRSRYNFLGWSTNPSATSATYTAGAVYPTNADTTLYAVWEKANYEFSVSITSVSNPTPYRYGEITVKVRADNWDNVNAYSNIPIQLYYNGQLMSTQNVNFTAYGVANLTFTLYVGDTPGVRTIEARINWSDRSTETDPSNNSASTTINVKELDYAMSIESVTVSDRYHAGETVITSFMVSNDSRYDITPDKNNTAIFTAYYYNGSNRVVITTATWNNVVIPGDKSNIVYFKWTIPSGMTGKTVYCECTINADSAVNEEDMENNTAVLTMTIASLTDSQTPNTRFENTKPGSYKGYGVPAEETEKATWTMWVYENNQFVLKSYGVQISSADPVITPGADCKTAVYENGKWTIRSGYGFTLSYTPTVITTSGYNAPDSSAYTDVQYVIAEFPEFNYADSNGNCRTLVYVDGKWQFVKNTYAADNERVHFIPVWFVDGDYTVSVTASRVWTPAGVISATRTSNPFAVDGSVYDDYFVGN